MLAAGASGYITKQQARSGGRNRCVATGNVYLQPALALASGGLPPLAGSFRA
jgi:hypothetical protein